jgi:uncharacterized protein (DUF1919 family)
MSALISLTKRLAARYERARLRRERFVIVSNNCWGSPLYPTLDRPYNTPFVGLFLHPECFVGMLERGLGPELAELRFTDRSRHATGAPAHPVALLPGDFEVHFLHYASREEAMEKWSRRLARMRAALAQPGTRLLLKLCDREGCTEQHLARFHAIAAAAKVSFGVRSFPSPQHVAVPQLRDDAGPFVVDGGRLYANRYQCFDLTTWVRTGEIRQGAFARFFGLANHR